MKGLKEVKLLGEVSSLRQEDAGQPVDEPRHVEVEQQALTDFQNPT